MSSSPATTIIAVLPAGGRCSGFEAMDVGTDGSWPARLIDNTEPITPSGFPLLSEYLI